MYVELSNEPCWGACKLCRSLGVGSLRSTPSGPTLGALLSFHFIRHPEDSAPPKEEYWPTVRLLLLNCVAGNESSSTGLLLMPSLV